MAKTSSRTTLPKAVQQELDELLLKLSVPTIVQILASRVLTCVERKELGLLDVDESAIWEIRLPGREIVAAVARHQQFTFNRAILELARSVDLILVGKYEQLRRAIGEPVVVLANDVPEWDSDTGKLTYKGKTVRSLSRAAIRSRLILDVFQEEGWKKRINSPFGAETSANARRRAVQTLNSGQETIRFYWDGTGQGIQWDEA
jgi:hypothetical protein